MSFQIISKQLLKFFPWFKDSTKLGLESKTQFNYFVKGDTKKSNDKQVDNHPAKKIVYLEGRAIPLESLNVIKFDKNFLF